MKVNTSRTRRGIFASWFLTVACVLIAVNAFSAVYPDLPHVSPSPAPDFSGFPDFNPPVSSDLLLDGIGVQARYNRSDVHELNLRLPMTVLGEQHQEPLRQALLACGAL